MSLKKGDDFGGEDFGRTESMSTKRSADQSIGVCRRIVNDNSDTCGKVVTSCTSDAEVVTLICGHNKNKYCVISVMR